MTRYLVFAGLLASNAALAASPMQAGLWEITTKMEMPGMPAGMGQQTVRQCIRPNEAENPEKTLPKDDQCQVKDYRLQGNSASWRMECRGEGQMTGTGSITYGGTSYSGTIKMNIRQGGQAMAMTQTLAGKRIGDCK